MKRILLGAAIAAVAAFGVSSAMAADSTAYMAACKANIAAEKPPAGSPVTDAMRLALCQCIADSGDQAVIDEATAMQKLPRDQRMAKFQSASDKFKSTMGTCRTKAGFPAPPAGATGSP